MSEKAPISIVVPVYNMADHVQVLWNGLKQSGTVDKVQEIIFVNDGSTDQTEAILENIKLQCKIIKFERNEGRFTARQEGAKAATQSKLLFLDARIRIPDDFSAQLDYLLNNAQSAVGEILIDGNESIYSLYWKLSHEFIFSYHYQNLKKGQITLTSENYDDFLKGTGLFFCEKEIFLEVCHSLEHLEVKSDDTLLMKEYVKRSAVLIDSNFHTYWSPRQNLKGFLERVWERGPSFVEYHVLERKGKFFYVTMLMLAYFFVMISFLFVSFSFFISFFLFSMALISLTAILFVKNLKDFFKIFPLHVATVVSFFLSILTALLASIFKIKG